MAQQAGTKPSPSSPGPQVQTASQQITALEPDPEPQITDDDEGTSGTGSATASLASSVLKYRMENGRTYHAYKAGAYFMPNDENENDRLDLQHNLCILMQDNQLFLSPVGKVNQLKRVLDAGCGTGIWSMDFADEHPETQVTGVDLSPIQPTFVPPNVEFYVDDLESDWTFSTPFDLVYMRMLSGSIKNWPKLFGQAFNHINPGGYIEVCDPINPMDCDDGTLPEDSALLRWTRLLRESSAKLGAGLDSAEKYKQQLIEAGFVDVVQKEFRWPVNTWPKDPKHKELGAWTYENVTQGLQALSLLLFTHVLGWTPEELEVFLVDVRKDMKDRKIHGYWRVLTVYGKKPQ